MASCKQRNKIIDRALSTGNCLYQICDVIFVSCLCSGDLVIYEDHRNWCLFTRKIFYDKWLRLIKWEDGLWRPALIIGHIKGKVMVEIELNDDDDIRLVKSNVLYPWKNGVNGKRWKKKDATFVKDSQVYAYICEFA